MKAVWRLPFALVVLLCVIVVLPAAAAYLPATHVFESPVPTPTSSPAAQVSAVSPTAAVAIGASAVIPVHIDNAVNLWGTDLKLTYDSTVLQCTQVQAGTIPYPDTVAKATCTGGAAEYIATQLAPRAPASGSGDAVRFTFQCLKAGTSALHLEHASLVDIDGLALGSTTTDGQITCSGGTSPTVTPIPTSYTILGNHTVKAGESLYCIARAYRVSPWAIASQNNVAWPYTIYPGQVLAIPNVTWYNIPPGPTCAPQFGTGPTPTPSATCSAYYIIQWGDTLLGIARRYNVNVYTLASVNHIYNLNLIYAGSTLCIP